MEATDHIAFVSSIQLAEPKYSLPENVYNSAMTLPPDNQKEGYVVAGGLTAFTENVKGQAKQDILNATLLSQLYSDRKCDRGREPTEWYGCYKYVLNQLGFITQEFNFVSYETSDETIKLDEVVIKILSEIANEEESAVLTEILDAMRKLSRDDKKIALFDKHGSHSRYGNFQVCSCDQAPDGEVSLSLGAFYFKSNDKDNNFFFFAWDPMCTMITCATQKLVLNCEMYARVRSAVSAKLRESAANLVASITI